MKVHAYANCWNEARMLPFFMRHYSPFVDKFIINDDGSTDGSVEYLKAQDKVELIQRDRGGTSYIEQSRIFFNEAWKESRAKADWIITCNIDEHIFHKDIAEYLHHCLLNGITILPALGYEMVSLEFPLTQGRLCDQVRLGARSEMMHNKIMAFNPQAIEDVNFSIGRHGAHPSGTVVYPSTVKLKLLHYKFLGLDYTVQRYIELSTGLSLTDIANGYGCQYTWDRDKIRRSHEAIIFLAEVVVPGGLIPDAKLILTILPLKTRLLFSGHALRLIRNLFVRILKIFLNPARKVISSIWLQM